MCLVASEYAQGTQSISHRAKAARAKRPVGAVWVGTDGETAGLNMPVQLQHARGAGCRAPTTTCGASATAVIVSLWVAGTL